MNQSHFLAITCNSLEAREKSPVRGAIGFGFASHWLKYWRDSFKPITKRSNRNHVITFDSHLKTALPKILHFISFLLLSSFHVIYIQRFRNHSRELWQQLHFLRQRKRTKMAAEELKSDVINYRNERNGKKRTKSDRKKKREEERKKPKETENM